MKSDVPAAFRVTKGASDQTGLTNANPTTVSWGTEVYDSPGSGYFASDTWTPPAGFIYLGSIVKATGTFTSDTGGALYFYKNGSALRSYQAHQMPNTSQFQMLIETMDQANGSDAYTVVISLNISSGTGTVSGDITTTQFFGHWISP